LPRPGRALPGGRWSQELDAVFAHAGPQPVQVGPTRWWESGGFGRPAGAVEEGLAGAGDEQGGQPGGWRRPAAAVTRAGRAVSSWRTGKTLQEDIVALRIPKAEVPAELREAFIERLGSVPEPLEVGFNNPDVAMANQEFAGKVGAWNAADECLKTFAHMAVAAQVGCSWCLDINYFLALNQNLDLTKASQVPRWRESDVFTPLEREVLEYAEAMTDTPTTVSDELSASLLARLGPAALVELTVFIGFANLSTRVNTAHGITSQGYSAACAIPLAKRAGTSGVASGS
jgi:alkylhydroperoxidase family enzyme